MVTPKKLNSQSGQATVEYILLLTVIISLLGIVMRGIGSGGIARALMRPLQQDFARTYQYGDPRTLGFDDDGGPQRHPRIHNQGEGGASGNFRMFINQP